MLILESLKYYKMEIYQVTDNNEAAMQNIK